MQRSIWVTLFQLALLEKFISNYEHQTCFWSFSFLAARETDRFRSGLSIRIAFSIRTFFDFRSRFRVLLFALQMPFITCLRLFAFQFQMQSVHRLTHNGSAA